MLRKNMIFLLILISLCRYMFELGVTCCILISLLFRSAWSYMRIYVINEYAKSSKEAGEQKFLLTL